MRCAVLALAAGLVACSPPDLGAPLAAFSDSIGKAETTFAKVDQAATARENQRRIDRAVLAPGQVVIRDAGSTECLPVSTACAVMFEGRPLRAASLMPQHRVLLRDIGSYAEALKQITAADSTAKVKAAADKATAAISGIAALVSGGPAAAFAAPVAQLATWLYGRYQDNLKRSALRHATGEMAPVLDKATLFFTTTNRLAILPGARTAAAREVSEAADEFRLKPSAATATAYLDKAERLDALLKASPEAVFVQINETHKELVRVLADTDLSIAELFKRIDKLAGDIEALFKAIEAFEKAAG